MKKLIAGNWKMNGNRTMVRTLISEVVNALDAEQRILDRADIAVFPPALYLSDVRHTLYGFPVISFGMQDISEYEDGAYTGDISASMAADAACTYVILGHSERRQYHGETNEKVKLKAELLLAEDITPIICVGETESEREMGNALKVVGEQLENCIPVIKNNYRDIVVAYEPVWAIGTGKTALPEDIRVMHQFIREKLEDKVPDASKVRILYGGSMKPENAAEILHIQNVDGGLIGGASLKTDTFLAIAREA
tara:strand:- start:1672 stop:2427 length:756 start_codon:yes stop_codon:yes gene_type:complete